MVKGFSHVGLYVRDIARAAQFYMDVFDGENLGFFTAGKHGCWLKLGEAVLEIFESPELSDGCFKHVALDCDDVDAAFDRALANGGQALVEPKEITLALAEPVKARIAFVRGVCGEQIELFCRHDGWKKR